MCHRCRRFAVGCISGPEIHSTRSPAASTRRTRRPSSCRRRSLASGRSTRLPNPRSEDPTSRDRTHPTFHWPCTSSSVLHIRRCKTASASIPECTERKRYFRRRAAGSPRPRDRRACNRCKSGPPCRRGDPRSQADKRPARHSNHSYTMQGTGRTGRPRISGSTRWSSSETSTFRASTCLASPRARRQCPRHRKRRGPPLCR